MDKNGWIKVTERVPEKDDLVIVFGIWNGEINGKNSAPTVGLAEWKSIDYSQCPDGDAYSSWYSDITHYQPLPSPPKTEHDESK